MSDPPEWLTFDGEEIRWRGSPRVQAAIPWLAVAAAGVVLGTIAIVVEAVPWPAAAAVPLSLAIGAWGYLRVVRTEFLVTTRAVYARSGVLGVRVTSVDLERIQNTSASQHALGRVVGYGTVEIDTAGSRGTELAFWNVEDPQRVRSLVDAQVDRAGGSELPGSVEQWETVLAEVRAWRVALERE